VALAFAFGMAVTGTITIATLLYFYVARSTRKTPLWMLIAGATVLLAVDLLFVAAYLTKLVRGAWLPLLIGLTAFTVMTTWQRGREIVTTARKTQEGPLREFVEKLPTGKALIRRVPGTAIFLYRGKETAPLALRANVEHNHVRHEHIVIMSIETAPVPRVPASERIAVDGLGDPEDGILHVTARYGYMETTNVPAALRTLERARTLGELDLQDG
jgi:KUP system potassium uptake protein